jgi:HD-GYP domain-containing protein (c-di-GMP phosphodiesterase class II)
MESLIAAMEGMVEDLHGHVHRVSGVATSIGFEMGIIADDIDRLRVVGILHDVGKIHVDPAILAKPGPLVGDEVVRMRRHPEFGFAMTVEVCDEAIAEAILYHHERFDGAGYPYGLKGDQIPLLARIVLVADAFDAITSHRSYQPAFPAEYAIEEIIANSGSQFDPSVVDAFLHIAERGSLPKVTTRLSGVAAR